MNGFALVESRREFARIQPDVFSSDVSIRTKTLCVRAGTGFRADPAQKMPTSVVW